MPWTFDATTLPTADAAGAMANLALAVVSLCVHDLSGPPCARRNSARAAVHSASLTPWLEMLDLSADAQDRVLALLTTLAH